MDAENILMFLSWVSIKVRLGLELGMSLKAFGKAVLSHIHPISSFFFCLKGCFKCELRNIEKCIFRVERIILPNQISCLGPKKVSKSCMQLNLTSCGRFDFD